MGRPEWVVELSKFEDSGIEKSLRQTIATFIAYFTLLAAMYLLLHYGYPYWTALLLAPVAALFGVKIFIILHDCSHKSYLGRSVSGCFILGHLCGILTFTSFFAFRRSHLIHHATVSNLEKRGAGDIWTLTVKEYLAAPAWKRAVYRIFRNPFFLFGIAPTLLFILTNRFPKMIDRSKEVWSIIFTDLSLALIILAAHFTIGLKLYLAIQLPVIYLAAGFGVWIFYIQHQFENAYWSHNDQYDGHRAAMEGSSFYKLPRVLDWFSGSIGYHHLHHVNFRVPNFNIKDCYSQTPQLQQVHPITVWEGFRHMRLALWDEDAGKLVSFGAANKHKQ